MPNKLRPLDYQPALKVDQFIDVDSQVSPESVPMDVLFVGGGPAGLAGAIHLAQLIKAAKDSGKEIGDIQIGVLEKAQSLGGHTLSGGVMNPRAIERLFPKLPTSEMPLRTAVKSDRVYFLTKSGKIRIPTPPTMHNSGNYVVSLCEVVRWLGQQAENLGINVLTSFPADKLLTQNGKVIGVRTVPQGLKRDGSPGSQFMPGTDITAGITVLAEGTRGPLAQSYIEWKKISRKQKQIFALGVKEVWKVKKAPESVIHTLGHPLPLDVFGGSFLYPMANDMVSFGLVAGLDYRPHNLDVHGLLQQLKNHPLFAQYLAGGELLEWGAKTIPEGGYHSLPETFVGDGLMMVGDTVGLVNVPALKGIHYAMESGMLAAETILDALLTKDTSAKSLDSYNSKIRSSYIYEDLKSVRNIRQAFHSGFFIGGMKASLMTLTKGCFPGDSKLVDEDAAQAKEHMNTSTSQSIGLSKVDGVYRAGNKTRDDIPSHLTVGKDIPKEIAEMYVSMCPAGVYELKGTELIVNAPNCIDCKATDVIGPRWQPREGGSGPNYQFM